MNDREMEELKKHLTMVGKQSILADRYLLKRVWGIYYAIWSLTIFIYMLLPYTISLVTSSFTELVIYIVAFSAVTAIAGYFSARVFARSAKHAAMRLRLSNRYSRRFHLVNYIQIAILMFLVGGFAATASGFLKNQDGGFLVSTILIAIMIFVLVRLKNSFGNIPLEGVLAASTFLFSCVSSLVSVALTGGFMYYVFFWIPTVVGWLFASFYSLYTAADSMASQYDTEDS